MAEPVTISLPAPVHGIINAIAVPVILIDGERVYYGNKAACGLFGKNALPCALWPFVEQSDHDRLRAALTEIEDNGEAQCEAITWRLEKHGERLFQTDITRFEMEDRCWFLITLTAAPEQENSLLLASAEDLALEKVFRHHQAVGLIIDPADGRIIDANDGAVRFYGWSRKELQKLKISEINTLEAETVHAEMKRAETRKHHIFFFKHRLASGEIRDVEVLSGPIFINGKALLYSIVHDISEYRRTESLLRAGEEKYHHILNSISEGFWFLCEQGKIREVNRGLCSLLEANDTELIGHSPGSLVCGKDREVLDKLIAEVRESGEVNRGVVEMIRTDGSSFPCTVTARPYLNKDDTVAGSYAFIEDITEARKTEERLQLAATVFRTTAEAIFVTNDDNRIEAVNPAFTRITGYKPEEVIGQDPKILRSDRHDDDYFRRMWWRLKLQGSWEGEIWNRRKNGEIFPEWLSIVAIRDEHDRNMRYVAVFSDITKRKKAEDIIRHQANYDLLTDLPNRMLFMDRLNHEITRTRRESYMLGLMFIDLDRFKWVNDTLGHLSGDRLLKEVADRLKRAVRASDTIARLGGDEFTVILPDLKSADNAETVARKIIDSLSEPIDLGKSQVFISASIGIATFPADSANANDLLRSADTAMYRAKEDGRNRYRFYTSEMDTEVMHRISMERDLRVALERDELRLYYQPIVRLADLSVYAGEALLRWEHPKQGLVSPGRFILLAEDTGLIFPIGKWVLRSACARAQEWLAKGMQLYLGVNLSSRQCHEKDFKKMMLSVLEESGLNPENLVLEISESTLIDDVDGMARMLKEMVDLGIAFSVDDFGTGYASISYLKRFPAKLLKIDPAFIANIEEDDQDRKLVSAMIHMAHKLNMLVVAEGVETLGQIRVLRQLGCDLAQGFYLSKPLPHNKFEDLVRKEMPFESLSSALSD